MDNLMNKEKAIPASAPDIVSLVTDYRNRAIESIKANNLEEARAIIAELMTLDVSTLISADLSVIKDFLDIPSTLLPTKEHQDLEQLFFKGLAILQNHNDTKPLDFVVLLNNLIVFYDQSGNNQGLNEAANHIVAIAEELTGALNSKVVEVFLHLGGLYEQSGEDRAVDILYRQVNRFMFEEPGLAHNTLIHWLSKYSRILISRGRFDFAWEQFGRALAKLDTGRGEDDIKRIKTLVAMAGSALAEKKSAKAEAAFEQAIQIAEQAGHEEIPELSAIYHNLATLYMQHDTPEQYDMAEQLIVRSLAVVAKAGKQATAEYAGGLGQRAVIAECKGELDRAEQFYNESFQIYEKASDTDKSEYSDFLSDAGFLSLKRKQPREAVTVFGKALELRKSVPGEGEDRLANAYSNLALAHYRSDNLDNAISLYTQAIDMRHRILTENRGNFRR